MCYYGTILKCLELEMMSIISINLYLGDRKLYPKTGKTSLGANYVSHVLIAVSSVDQ